ncbi:MAG: hypothetical protein FWE21_09450 [Defluviitaleaceae bacterium]|nr:hypothetical protein [Defluviitaleaceae bacterium]
MKKRILLTMAVAGALLFSGCGGDGNGNNGTNETAVLSQLAFQELRCNQTGNIAGMGGTLAAFEAAFGAYNTSESHGELSIHTFINRSLVVSFMDDSAIMIDLQPTPADIAAGRFTVQDVTVGITLEDLLAIDGVSGPYGWDDEHFGRVLNHELFSYVQSFFIENNVVSRIVITIAG